MTNKMKIIIIAAFWLILTLGIVVINEKIFITGSTICLKVRPVDPRDFLRGQYVSLNYDISRIRVDKNADFKTGERVFVVLKKDKNALNTNIYGAHNIEKTRPYDNTAYITGKITYIQGYCPDSKNCKIINIQYGIENLFTKEKEAKDIEKRLSDGGLAEIVLDKKGRARLIKVK